MLTALDRIGQRVIALPDYPSRPLVETLREPARRGHLVCRECEQELWLRAGEIKGWHFAHRSLSNCPLSRISAEVLVATRLLYQFFQSRIEAGKLPGEIQLEPVVRGLPDKVRTDLLLQREGRPAVAVVVLDKGLKPLVRSALPRLLEQKEMIFRPVFLGSRLKRFEETQAAVLLDPTEREFSFRSPYDLPHARCSEGSLHFLDLAEEKWITLRALSLWHDPQVYLARKELVSSMKELLWSESHAEWVHPGEAEGLKQHKERIKREKEQEARRIKQAREAEKARRERARQAAKQRLSPRQLEREQREDDEEELDEDGTLTSEVNEDFGEAAPARPIAPVEERPPVMNSLTCLGCGVRTVEWQVAEPGADRCVCRECFIKGVRFPSQPFRWKSTKEER